MKRYGTDLEKELKGLSGRINKRLKFLITSQAESDQEAVDTWELVRYDTLDKKIEAIKAIEFDYTQQTKQLDAFDNN